MKQFIAFVRKEFDHILRDTWTTVILAILPVIMLILFGFALNSDVKNSPLMVVDPSRDAVTEGIAARLAASEYFTFGGYLESEAGAESAFRSGKASLVIAFSDNFRENVQRTGDAAVAVIADGSDPNQAMVLVNYATNIIRDSLRGNAPADELPFSVAPSVKLLYNPGMKSAFNFVPGVMGMVLMLICAMMTSISITKEKEKGTMEVLLASPINPLIILLAKTVPYFALSAVNLATILIFAVLALDVPIAGSLALLIVVSLLFIFVALAFGLLISSVVSSQMVALLISGMGLMLPIMMLSGMMFPIENMPLPLRAIAQVLPAKWYISAVRNIMIKGAGIRAVASDVAVLAVMATALMGVSFKKFKARLE